VYRRKAPDAHSWYQRHDETSLGLIDGLGLGPTAAIIDVGAGSSTLVDDLLARGFENITILDIASTALEISKQRLGARAAAVTWLAADVRHAPLPKDAFDLWHDRAVFHFLTERSDRELYVDKLAQSVRSGGRVIMATFATDGPTRCSGLDVVRYDDTQLAAELGPRFKKLDAHTEVHTTPGGAQQSFLYAVFART
jgi:ubiquinone/menaquinone biosynthesis C-methylase UbiE